jgi:hypothetical protein
VAGLPDSEIVGSKIDFFVCDQVIQVRLVGVGGTRLIAVILMITKT